VQYVAYYNIPLPLVECLSDVRNINPFVLYYEIIENNHNNINHILSQMRSHISEFN